MDIKRDPKILRRKKIRNGIIIGILAIAATVATVAVSRLKPAAPTVPRSTVWTGVVKRGDFVREVRGAGTRSLRLSNPSLRYKTLTRFVFAYPANETKKPVSLSRSGPFLFHWLGN